MSNGLSKRNCGVRKEEQANETEVTEEMMAEDFTNLLEDLNLQILQDAYHTTIRMNMKGATLQHTRAKLLEALQQQEKNYTLHTEEQ